MRAPFIKLLRRFTRTVVYYIRIMFPVSDRRFAVIPTISVRSVSPMANEFDEESGGLGARAYGAKFRGPRRVFRTNSGRRRKLHARPVRKTRNEHFVKRVRTPEIARDKSVSYEYRSFSSYRIARSGYFL